MSDFDANEDLSRVPDAGREESPEQGAARPPIVRRVRQAGPGHARLRRPVDVHRSPISPLTRRRRAMRAARRCAGVRLFARTASRRTRRLWACHGQPPGSRS